MSFRVNNNNAASAALGAGPATKPAEAAPVATHDGLQLSKSADILSRIAENETASRWEKVSKLAAAGKGGSYRVESAKVSKAIVDHVISAGQKNL